MEQEFETQGENQIIGLPLAKDLQLLRKKKKSRRLVRHQTMSEQCFNDLSVNESLPHKD